MQLHEEYAGEHSPNSTFQESGDIQPSNRNNSQFGDVYSRVAENASIDLVSHCFVISMK